MFKNKTVWITGGSSGIGEANTLLGQTPEHAAKYLAPPFSKVGPICRTDPHDEAIAPDGQ